MDRKRELLHGLLHGSYAQVTAFHSGEILNRLNNDVKTLNEGLLTILPSTVSMVTRLTAAIAVLGALDPQLPQGLDTVIGESGAGLFEGQSQRLAIARAVLSGAPILLLDEATSALDEETEQKVLSRLRALENRTCIAVTHRSAALALCDWNLELQHNGITVTHK